MLPLLLTLLAIAPLRVPTDDPVVTVEAATQRCSDALKVAVTLGTPAERVAKAAAGCSSLFTHSKCRQAWASAPGGPVSELAAKCAQAYCPKWTSKTPRRTDPCTFDWAAATPGEVSAPWSVLFRKILEEDWGSDGWEQIKKKLTADADRLAHGLEDGMTPLVALAKPDFTVRLVVVGDQLKVTLEDSKGTPMGCWKSANNCSPRPNLEGLKVAALALFPERWLPWASYSVVSNRNVRICSIKAVMAAFDVAGMRNVSFYLDPPLGSLAPEGAEDTELQQDRVK